MKRLSSLFGAALILAAASKVHAEYSRFWSYYDPHPSNYIGSKEWWEGDALLGDWWGVRNYLDDAGIEISATYTNNIAGNVVGGLSQGFAYADNFSFGVALDMEKLVNWQGATITVSGLNRDGNNLSQRNIGNQFTVQQVYGGSAVMFYGLILEQKLIDDKVSIKVGRFATGDDFASSPIYWLYMNNGIDGNPQSLPVNTQFSAYPWAVWAARVKVQPTKEWSVMTGAYQVSERVFVRNYHGLDWSIRPNDGILLISQVGYSPELFKREVPTTTTNSGKSVSDGKTAKNPVTPTEMKGLPGHYWFGAYWSPWQFNEIGSTTKQTERNSFGFYWHADQMVFQEAPGSDEGLTAWTALTLSPQQGIAKLPFQVNGGLVYKGLIPLRDDDMTTVGVVFGKFSEYSETAQGQQNYELVFETGYKIQLNKFAFFQPNVQWVINPGGTGNIPNALVLGAQMGVTF